MTVETAPRKLHDPRDDRASGHDGGRMARTAILGMAAVAIAALSPSPAAAAPSASGRIVYSNNTTTPQNSVYTAGSPGSFAAGPAMPAGALPTFMVDRASPKRNEHIAGYVTSGGVLYVYRFNGSSWVNETSAAGGWGGTVTVGGDGVNGRRFDIAYENVSGDAIVVYSTNVATTNELAYRVWTASTSTWSAAANINPAYIANIATWVKLLPRPGTDEIALTVCDTGTTTTNTADLTSLIWSGSAWANEPASAHSTSIYSTGTTLLVQNDLFDMAWESITGDLIVVFTQATTSGQYYRLWTRSTATWGTSTTFPGNTARTPPLQMVAASDPNSDNIVVAWNRSASGSIYASTWTGSAWTTTVATAGTTGVNPPAINKKTVGAEWMVAGGTSYAVVLWGTATGGTVGYNTATVSGTTVTWGTAASQAFTGTFGAWAWMDSNVDPLSPDALELTFSDGNSALWARQLTIAGGVLTSATDSSAALTLSLTATNGILTQNFSFAYDRYFTLTLGDGGAVANSTISLGQVAALDAFTLTPSAGTAAVGTVTATLTGNTALQNVFVNSSATCNGTTYGTLASPATSASISTTGLGVSAATTLYLCGTAAGPLTATIVTGVVTGATAPGFTSSGTQTSATQVTVNPPPVLTLGAATASDPANSSVTKDGVDALSAFTLTPASGTATVSSIAVTLTGAAAVASVSIQNTVACTGGAASYGSLPSPVLGSNTISIDGLGVSAATTLYVCITAASVAASTTVTGYVSGVVAAGYNTSGTDSSATVVTVTVPPLLNLATGTDPASSSVTKDGVDALDAFTLAAASGTAPVSSITVTLTNAAAIASVSIQNTVNCTGGAASFGSLSNPSNGSNTISISGLNVPASPATTLYVCMTAAYVTASTNVTGYVTGAVAPGYNLAGTDSSATVVTVTAPTSLVTIASGTDPASSSVTYTVAPGPVDALDAVTLTASPTGAVVQSITVSVATADTAAVKDVFINSTSACTGTTYGSLAGPGGTIPISGVTLSAATTLYVCITAGVVTATTTVTGYVAAVNAVGYGTTGSDSSATVVTVNPPTPTPVISIVNPRTGAVVSAGGTGKYKVQARVYLSTGIPGVTSVTLSTDGGLTFPTTMTQNANYSSGSPTVTSTVFEYTIVNPAVATGVVLQARAATASATTTSRSVTINIVAAGTGDGNLLVRDNAAQLCSDCHAVQTHSSEGTGLQYGAWAVQCRDCHTPHTTRNVNLVRESIIPPGQTLGKSVGFVTKIGDSVAPGWDTTNARPTSTASYVNSDYTGPCQVCHTQTQSPTGQPRWRNTNVATTDAHYKGASTVRCASCHMHTSGFKGGSCITCHSVEQPITKGPLAGAGTRRAVVLEFSKTWSHKRSAGGVVTKYDCIACHMEGDAATGSPSSVHADGYVNLRDPDTGVNIKGVTFTGGSGTNPGNYSSTTADEKFARFSRNLTVTLEADPNAASIQAIMINECLKCHDSNGALSTAARVPGGTAEKPFGTTVTYTTTPTNPSGAGVTANGVVGGVTDINASFQTTNSSYHPVLGKQNNWYAKLTRMATPWNAATPSRGATVDATSWGWLLSCWDCHALPSDTGKTITSTVTAHGGTATLRGVPAVSGTPAAGTNQVTLCIKCHAQYDTQTQPTHGTNSAFSSSGDPGMTPYMQYGCNICHSSAYTTAAVRPVRAQDVHGVNALPTGGGTTLNGRWSGASTGTPAQIDARPYAFIRDTQVIGNHQPARIGGSTYSAQCATPSPSFNTCSTMQTYTVGGTY